MGQKTVRLRVGVKAGAAVGRDWMGWVVTVPGQVNLRSSELPGQLNLHTNKRNTAVSVLPPPILFHPTLAQPTFLPQH